MKRLIWTGMLIIGLAFGSVAGSTPVLADTGADCCEWDGGWIKWDFGAVLDWGPIGPCPGSDGC